MALSECDRLGMAKYADTLAFADGTTNLSLASHVAVNAGTAINALRLGAGGGLTGGGTLSVGSGMIIAQAGNGGTGGVTLDFGNREGIVITEGNLTVPGAIAGSSPDFGLTKDGPGTLILSGASSFAGSLRINSGVLCAQNAQALGAAGGSVLVSAAASLELAGNFAMVPKALTLQFSTLRNVSGDNVWTGPITTNAASIRVNAGSLTVRGNLSTSGTLTKAGPGALILERAITAASVATRVRDGTLASTANAGSPFSSEGVSLFGGTLRLAPAGAGSDVVLDGSAAGRRSLGVTERVTVRDDVSGLIPVTNGIVSAGLLGVDNDAARSGDFLTYDASTGLRKAAYSPSTNLQTAGASAVFHATTPQTLTANASVFALKNSGQTISLNGRMLTVGAGGTANPGTVILNGGSVAGGILAAPAEGELAIFTSLAGGTISSQLGNPLANNYLTSFGPGTLTVTGQINDDVVVAGGTFKFNNTVAGFVELARQAILMGTGTVSDRVSGGLISPGNSAGVLTARTTAPTRRNSSIPTSFAFEFTRLGAPSVGSPTNSGNDVLRLLNPLDPFTGALTADNQIDLYFNLTTGVRPGDTFLGGFLTGQATAFEGSILGASWRVFLADPFGDTTFNGVRYRTSSNGVAVSTVPFTYNPGTGTVTGRVTQFQVVPEPGVGALILAAAASLRLTRKLRHHSG